MNHDLQQELINGLEMQVEKHLQTAIGVFQNLTEEQLLRQPEPGKWSIAQCLWHLNSYGDFYFPLIDRNLVNNTDNGVFNPGWFGSYFVKMMNPVTGKKYKAFKAHTPPPQPDAYTTVATFINQQEQLMGFLKRAREANLGVRLPISISTLIKLKLGDVLQFIVMHNERHMQQASRVPVL
jgi:uncharacterized damage-inducible protein DinB